MASGSGLRRRALWSALIVLALAPASSRAEDAAPPDDDAREAEFTAIQLRGGQAFAAGGLGGRDGLLLGTSIIFQHHPRWGFSFDVDYFAFNKDTAANLAPAPANMERRDLAILLSGRCVLFPQKPISPALSAGIGFHYWDVTHSHTDSGAAVSHSGAKLHRGFGYKGAGMLGADVTGRSLEALIWTVGARWFLLPEPREFRSGLSAAPGQAVTLAASVGLEF